MVHVIWPGFNVIVVLHEGVGVTPSGENLFLLHHLKQRYWLNGILSSQKFPLST